MTRYTVLTPHLGRVEINITPKTRFLGRDEVQTFRARTSIRTVAVETSERAAYNTAMAQIMSR